MPQYVISINMTAVIKPVTSVKQFLFSGPDGDENLSVNIPEVVDPRYGMYVWPCAPVLAQFLWHHKHQVNGKKVLELGAGTSLPGIVAAKCGARVTLSDASHLAHCLENCRTSCHANSLDDVRVLGVTWGHIGPDLIKLHPDIILGSDCFYDTKDFENILMTVAFLMEANPSAELWTTYQERSSDRSLVPLLDKWGLHCMHVPLEYFGATSSHLAGSDLPGNHAIQMLIITRKGQACVSPS